MSCIYAVVINIFLMFVDNCKKFVRYTFGQETYKYMYKKT